MNKTASARPPSNLGATEAELIHGAIRAAVERTSIRLSIKNLAASKPGSPRAAGGDARLTLDMNGVAQQYFVAARTRLKGREDLDAIAARSRHADVPTLLVTPHLSAALAQDCVRQDLQFMDLAGNLHLRAPGQYVLVIGRAANEEIRRLRRATGQPVTSASASALRMIFGLLCEPDLVNRPYREIAAATGIALGIVGPVLDDLRERRLLSGKEGRHGRRILDPETLRDEWLTNYPIRLRPKLRIQRFAAQDPSWWENSDLRPGEAWWGGEVAAWKATGQLRPAAQTLYVMPAARQDVLFDLVKQHRLRADPQGTLEILDVFWDFGETTVQATTVPPLLIYADLIRTREPRNLEAAASIREQWNL